MGGAGGVGAASGGSRRRCFTGCSPAVESARGAGVREGVLGADFRPFGNDGPMSGTGPCSGIGVPSRRRTGTGALGECQCIDALQTLTAASFVKPEDWIYGSNPGNWIAKYNTRKQGECNAVTARCRDQTAPTQSTGTVAASGPRFLLGACGRHHGSVGGDRCRLGVFPLGACCQCRVWGGGQDLDGRGQRSSVAWSRPSSAVSLRSSSDAGMLLMPPGCVPTRPCRAFRSCRGSRHSRAGSRTSRPSLPSRWRAARIVDRERAGHLLCFRLGVANVWAEVVGAWGPWARLRVRVFREHGPEHVA